MPPKTNERENIYVLIDEAHRTRSGKLCSYLMASLPNATYISFTGTPISKSAKGQNTFLIFGKEDQPYRYLSKYSISESIKDGTTVSLYYTLASNELLVDRETLDKEFLALEEAEGIAHIKK